MRSRTSQRWDLAFRCAGFVLLVGAWLLLATAPGWCPFGKKPGSSEAVVVPSAPEGGHKPQLQEVPNPRFANPPAGSGQGSEASVSGGASSAGAPEGSGTGGRSSASLPSSSGDGPANLPPTPVPRASQSASVEPAVAPGTAAPSPGAPRAAGEADDVLDDVPAGGPAGRQVEAVPAMADRTRHDALPPRAGPVESEGRSAPNFLGMPLKQQDTRGRAGRGALYFVGSLAVLALLVLVMRGAGPDRGPRVAEEKPALLLPDFERERKEEFEAVQEGVEPPGGEPAPGPPTADARP